MIKLNELSTLPPKGVNKEDIKEQFTDICKELADYQERLYAEKKHSILLILQGMDASGKSSTVRDVFTYVNPMGIKVQSFKKPTDEEFSHDFLWRVHKVAPAKGMIRVFDRSHYEDILIQRVHKWIDEDRVKQRIKHINNFEELLIEENNTTILKFYLHISKEEQYEDLMERQTEPEKFWKHNDADWTEREHWEKYMQSYETVFNECSPEVPWIIVPGDKSWYKKYIVAETLLNKLKALNPQFPPKSV